MSEHPGRQPRTRVLETALAVGLLASIYCTGLSRVAFHRDEGDLIANSNKFEEFAGGRFLSPAWNESYWMLTQPPLSRYVIGLGRRAGGFNAAAAWDPQKDLRTNVSESGMPSDRLLWWSRLPMSILAVASIAMGFVLLRVWGGRLSAWIWIALATMNDYFLLQLRRAMGEAPLILFLMLAFVLCARALAERPDGPRGASTKWFSLVALVGVSIGLAAAAKLNGFSVVAGGMAMIVLSVLRMRTGTWRRVAFAASAMLVLTLSMAGAFVAVNPFLWPEPIARTGRMFLQRVEETRMFEVQFPETRIEGPLDRVKTVTSRVFYHYASLGGSGSKLIDALGNGLLFLGGLSFCLWQSRRWLTASEGHPAPLVLILVASWAGIPMLFTPLDWDRYYLIPVYFSSMFVAVALGQLPSWLGHLRARLRA